MSWKLNMAPTSYQIFFSGYEIKLEILWHYKSISHSCDPNGVNGDVDTATVAEYRLNWVNAYRQKVRRQIRDISRRPAAARPY